MTKADKIIKRINWRLDALEDLRRFKKILTTNASRQKVNKVIKDLCEELNCLQNELYND